jgi:hypothetical protein
MSFFAMVRLYFVPIAILFSLYDVCIQPRTQGLSSWRGEKRHW